MSHVVNYSSHPISVLVGDDSIYIPNHQVGTTKNEGLPKTFFFHCGDCVKSTFSDSMNHIDSKNPAETNWKHLCAWFL